MMHPLLMILMVRRSTNLRSMRLGEIQYVEGVAERMCRDQRFGESACARLLSLFAGTCGNLKVPRAPDGKGMVLGAFVHGGSFGVTRCGRDLPWVTRYFNQYMKAKVEKCWPEMKYSWTTLAIQSAEEVPLYRDSRNERGTLNYVTELKTDSLVGLWVEDEEEERQVQGGSSPRRFQYEDVDGKLRDGCLVDVTKRPAVFDPRAAHAYVKNTQPKWFLSAYTPQGAYKLTAFDKEYLRSLCFPMEHGEEAESHSDGALETRPVLKMLSFPAENPLSGAQGEEVDVDGVTVGDCEATLWEWGLYEEDQRSGDPSQESSKGVIYLNKLCSSDDPRAELQRLSVAPDLLEQEEVRVHGQEDMGDNVEYWSAIGLHDGPRLAKLEPEYVEGIEEIITKAVETNVPLRHTYNVSPHEAKAVIQKWKPSITKEVGVVERGFQRVTTEDVAMLKQQYVVQELPSKLVYTVKPPADDSSSSGEQAFCKRKARIVCCGNYAAEDQGELFAGGAAAESLRCALTYTAKRRWRSGITDITGAFMLTPLPSGPDQVVYIIRPPAVLIQLGLADANERWRLTHGMYGLRQSPKLWSAFRDQELKQLVIQVDDKQWCLCQGLAEPNMWLIRELGAPGDHPPEGLVLVYVDDILVSGPLWLVKATSAAIRAVWKASELDVLDVDHEVRFLGCEIAVSEEYDAVYIHQRPYIEEVLRHHGTPEVDQSPIQAPKEMVTFQAAEGEETGTEEEIKQAQKACGELLWIAQRSRPDISFVVSAMGTLLTRAAPRCLSIARRLRSYLQRTKNLALTLRPCDDQLTVFTDSSFAPEGG